MINLETQHMEEMVATTAHRMSVFPERAAEIAVDFLLRAVPKDAHNTSELEQFLNLGRSLFQIPEATNEQRAPSTEPVKSTEDFNLEAVTLPSGLRQYRATFAPSFSEEDALTRLSQKPPGSFFGKTLEQLERQALVDTITACKGDLPKVADHLGVSLKTVYNKLQSYGLYRTVSLVRDQG